MILFTKALQILERLEHRGAVSSDGKTGDGAGILTDIPHELFVNDCHFDLPSFGQYAAGNVFLPKKENQRNYCISVFEKCIKEQGLNVLGWREVPVDPSVLGTIAQETEPEVKQIFITKKNEQQDDFNFNLKLFIARKKAEHEIYNSKLSESNFFYLPSLSTKVIIYKGLLIPEDIKLYYRDLENPLFVTRLALVHQRFRPIRFQLGIWHNLLDICVIMEKLTPFVVMYLECFLEKLCLKAIGLVKILNPYYQ